MIVNNSTASQSAATCRVCAKSSALQCERCGDAYCSVNCQDRDWNYHRFICIPRPRLIPISGCANGTSDCRDVARIDAKPSLAESKKNPQKPQASPLKTLERPTADYPLPNSTVLLTGFSASDSCSVVSADPDSLEAYSQLLRKIDNYGKSAKPLKVQPTIGTYVISYGINGFNRARVMSFKANKVRLLFIDTGLVNMRGMNELLEITPEILTLKQHALEVKLKGVESKFIFGEHVKYYDTYLQKKFTILYDETSIKKNIPIVELVDQKTNVSINRLISEHIHSKNKKDVQSENKLSVSNGKESVQENRPPEKKNTIVYDETSIKKNIPIVEFVDPKTNVSINQKTNDVQSVKKLSVSNVKENGKKNRPPVDVDDDDAKSTCSSISVKKSLQLLKAKKNPILEPPFKFKKLEMNEKDILMMVVDATDLAEGIFSAVKKDEINYLQQVSQFLLENKPNNEPYEPICNEYCLALFDDLWYRAKCESVVGDYFHVLYIDFCNARKLTKDKIRRYPVDCNIDCVTHICFINGLDKLDEKKIKLANDFGVVFGSEIIIDQILEEAEGLYIVEMKKLIESMRNL